MTENVGNVTNGEPGFSVVIPAYGPPPHLAKLVRSLVTQTPSPAKIVVVHTGSDDPTAEIAALAATEPVPVKVIHEDRRMYAGAARNRGVEQVKTPWVAFLDCDVLPAPDYCAALARRIQETEAACLVGTVEPASLGGYWGLCMWFIEFGSVHPYLPPRSMDTGPSANMIARRDVLLDVGGFPPGSGEDALCQLNMREQTGRLLFVPEIRIGHHMVGGFSSYRRHLIPLGAAAARVRSVHTLTGSKAATNPFLAAGLWLARIGQIGLRVFRYGRGERLRFLVLMPGILLGLLIWNWGFWRYVRAGNAPELEPEVDAGVLRNWRPENEPHSRLDRRAPTNGEQLR